MSTNNGDSLHLTGTGAVYIRVSTDQQDTERQYAADRQLIDELSNAMGLASICGLGQIVPAPIGSVLKYFGDEVREHALNGTCPSGICHHPGAPAKRAPTSTRVGINP